MKNPFKNLDKVLWKEDGYTKGDLLKYYEKVAPLILPYLKDRPLVLNRFPDGIEGGHFYQKNAGVHVPKFVKTIAIHQENKWIHYIVVQNIETLLYVANLVTELHIFNARIGHLEKPDYMVFDIDPLGVPFRETIKTARLIHDMLDEMDAPNFCKTSGGKGLHIYVPTRGKYTHDQIKTFVYLFAIEVQKRLPDLISLKRMPSKRHKKIYIDYLQNRRHQTMVAPYSVRAFPHAPVSMPLKWSEVKPGLDPLQFTLKTPIRKTDAFKGVLKLG